MEKLGSESAKMSSYESSRTRRSLLEGNIHNDDSNDDEEFASSGFYVREKKAESSPPTACVVQNHLQENGAAEAGDSEHSVKPVENGESLESQNDVKDPTEPVTTTEKENFDEESKSKETGSEEGVNSSKENEEQKKIEDSKNNVSEETIGTHQEDCKEDAENATHEIEEIPKKVEEEDKAQDKQEHMVEDKTTSEEALSQVESLELGNDEFCSNVEADMKVLPEEVSKEAEELQDPKEGNSEPEDSTGDNSKIVNEVENIDDIKKDTSEAEVDEKNMQEAKTDEEEVKQEEAKEEGKKETEEEGKKEAEEEGKKEAEENTKEKNTLKGDVVVKNEEEKGMTVTEDVTEETTENDITKAKTEKEEKSEVEILSKTEKMPSKSSVDLTQNEDSKKITDLVKTPERKGKSLLKDQLMETPSDRSTISFQDADMDEDFDPSLFCPDISMDVDEASVVGNEDHSLDNGSSSPLPYEPIFSTLVDEMTGAEVEVDLTPAEMELRQQMYGPDNPVQASKIHCTACNVHLGSALTGANNRFVHPLLKVLICKNCYHFYTSGEFEKDEDGSELYCRWCGQGGQVLCCSSCEFVFCKRCIKNNFGLKKFKDIRNSDDWNCFRCDPGQLSSLRASCAEFMEYYRTELARAQSLSSTNPDLMVTDYTKCCSTPAEKKEEPKATPISRQRRKRKNEEDPDYKPIVDDEPPVKKAALSTEQGYTMVSAAAAPSATGRPLAPKPNFSTATTVFRPILSTQGIRAMNAQGTVFKVGNTTFRNKAPGSIPGYTIQRPVVTQGTKTPNYITIPSSTVRTTTPGYIKIVPQSRMSTPTRPQGLNTATSGGLGNVRPGFASVRPTKPAAQMPAMKHEWFEKTVRAAARVNSNLSYTLTQLNRQQSQASSVEALAVVHNKLQEVLSTSINSLIQIRKNLRTEFISGIKNIKFPPKPAAAATVPKPPAGATVTKDDDDVIFVNPTTTASSTVTKNHLPQLIVPPSVTLTRKIAKPNSKITTTPPVTPSSGPSAGRGFLKVRSLTALQSVPTECIVIPDDPPASEEKAPKSPESNKNVDAETKVKRKISEEESKEDGQLKKLFNVLMVYNVKKKPSQEVKKMMSAVVNVSRSPEIEAMLRPLEDANGTIEILD